MLIKVKVHPKSKKLKITKKSQDKFEIFIKEPANRGLANKAVSALLAKYFKISKNKIRLIRGHKQRNKIIDIASQ